MNDIGKLAQRANTQQKSLNLDLAKLRTKQNNENHSTSQTKNNRTRKNKRQQQKIKRAVTLAGLFTLATLTTGITSFKISSTTAHNKQAVTEALKELDEFNTTENLYDLSDIGDKRDFSILLQQTEELLKASNSKFKAISEEDAKTLATNLDIISDNKDMVVSFAEGKIVSAIGKNAKITTKTISNSVDGPQQIVTLMENEANQKTYVSYCKNDSNSKFKNNKDLANALHSYLILCPPEGQSSCNSKEEIFKNITILFNNTKSLEKESISIANNSIVTPQKNNEQTR